MITPKFFFDTLTRNDINFFCGVPDSLLKSFCAYVTDNVPSERHIIPANEGSAVGLAAGYYLATQKYPLVYMQNSGFGNTVNPILSLADADVYSIPMVLLIGWRGEPGVKDEPQHIKQGKVTLDLLEAMGIEYEILSENEEVVISQMKHCLDVLSNKNVPFAFVVKKNTFDEYKLSSKTENGFELTREAALNMVMEKVDESDIVVSTTGMISRELYEYRDKMKLGHHQDFLTVGSMGHASQIALGIALQKKNRRIYCIDGDGAALMHLGGMAIIGSRKVENFVHIVLNNGAHDSVGGQPTVAFNVDFPKIALACGYNKAFCVSSRKEFDEVFRECKEDGPYFIELRVTKGARADLGRPKASPVENKNAFLKFLN